MVTKVDKQPKKSTGSEAEGKRSVEEVMNLLPVRIKIPMYLFIHTHFPEIFYLCLPGTLNHLRIELSASNIIVRLSILVSLS